MLATIFVMVQSPKDKHLVFQRVPQLTRKVVFVIRDAMLGGSAEDISASITHTRSERPSAFRGIFCQAANKGQSSLQVPCLCFKILGNGCGFSAIGRD